MNSLRRGPWFNAVLSEPAVFCGRSRTPSRSRVRRPISRIVWQSSLSSAGSQLRIPEPSDLIVIGTHKSFAKDLLIGRVGVLHRLLVDFEVMVPITRLDKPTGETVLLFGSRTAVTPPAPAPYAKRVNRRHE